VVLGLGRPLCGMGANVWLFRPPGVYRPQGDSILLAEAFRAAAVPAGARVLDVGTGTGMLALAAAVGGAGHVTAVDVCARAVMAARVNAWLRGLPIRVLQGDLLERVAGELFDVIVANPPYVCSEVPPSDVRGLSWNGGPRGRAVLDRLCFSAPPSLAPGGTLLVVQSAVCGIQATVDQLQVKELKVSVVARRYEPFGPVMRAVAASLEQQKLIEPGQRHEELVVIRADRAK
jgi:release factor glutamine methyltransferase